MMNILMFVILLFLNTSIYLLELVINKRFLLVKTFFSLKVNALKRAFFEEFLSYSALKAFLIAL